MRPSPQGIYTRCRAAAAAERASDEEIDAGSGAVETGYIVASAKREHTPEEGVGGGEDASSGDRASPLLPSSAVAS